MRDDPVRLRDEHAGFWAEPALSKAFGPVGSRILAVEAARLLPRALLSDRSRSVIIARMAGLDPTFLRRISPDVIAAPLFAGSFDIIDLILRVGKAGYRGRVIALTGLLPDPRAVEAEIRAGAGAVMVDLVELPDDD